MGLSDKRRARYHMVPLYESTKAEGGLLRSTSLFPEPPYLHIFPQFSFWLSVPTQKHYL